MSRTACSMRDPARQDVEGDGDQDRARGGLTGHSLPSADPNAFSPGRDELWVHGEDTAKSFIISWLQQKWR